ncbi:hypothetical protein NY406_06410 [Chlorobaculum sp. MV4-Y]|uniref:hypothetical protein n=1 Tax=Chlorobaculum sp. MV4-Y TaxID=2976335 RepID=UPI0021AF4179|nr:hypothetical protein [Chlorobaculum sp. MV4-Y]UWX56885.1 hypothetical protein NY406_06410 [Chlorobaculum sp. MV4-Y]
MDQKIIDKLKQLLSLLTEKQRAEDIIEITREDEMIFQLLESQGNECISYSIKSFNSGYLSESEGAICFWSKNLSGNWTVNSFNINRMLNANWEKE